MGSVKSSAGPHETGARRNTWRTADAAPKSLRLLASIDGSERTGRILEHAIDLATGGREVEVILLNVQPAPAGGRLRGYGSFKQAEIRHRLIHDLGERALSSASRRLETAGVAHKSRVELGDPVAAVLRCAEEEGCNLILVSEPELGQMRRWLLETVGLSFSSSAARVVQLAKVPVMVVK
jgi:nucleotide-binding universal stress UspA family protein